MTLASLPLVSSTQEGEPRLRLGGNYRRLWTASVVPNLGDGVAGVAYPWLASAVTRDPLQIALIGVANRLPWLLFSLPAGVIVSLAENWIGREPALRLPLYVASGVFLILLLVALPRLNTSRIEAARRAELPTEDQPVD